MRLERHMGLNTAATLIAFVVAASAYGGDAPGNSIITIGGVVYTDTQDPLRSGVAGVAVTVQGENGLFEATTAGILGLWKMDVPVGTYTVTPSKKDYVMQHLVGMWCDGERSITIEVNRKNLAANQSIQFLAVSWPEPTPEPQPATPAPRNEATGGGCAATRGRSGRAGDFFTPYVACLSVLSIRSRIGSRRRMI